MVIIGMPLDEEERPYDIRASEGRFIAKSDKFLDPEIFETGSEITLAGKITGSEKRPLGKSDCTFPVVKIEQLVLWNGEPGYYSDYGPYYYWPYPYAYWDWYWFDFLRSYRFYGPCGHFGFRGGGHRR